MKYSLIFLLSPRDCLPNVIPNDSIVSTNKTKGKSQENRNDERGWQGRKRKTRVWMGCNVKIKSKVRKELKNKTETAEELPKGATVSSAFFRLLFRSVGVVGAAAWADPTLAAIALELEILCCGPPLLLPPPLLPPRSGVRSSSFVLLSLSRMSSRSEEPVLRFESWLCWCCCCCCCRCC